MPYVSPIIISLVPFNELCVIKRRRADARLLMAYLREKCRYRRRWCDRRRPLDASRTDFWTGRGWLQRCWARSW